MRNAIHFLALVLVLVGCAKKSEPGTEGASTKERARRKGKGIFGIRYYDEAGQIREIQRDFPASIVTRAGERAQVLWGGDWELWIHDQSAVTIRSAKEQKISVERGEVLVERPGITGADPVHITLPTGEVEVVGTRVAFRVAPGRSVVSVLRGRVRATTRNATPAMVAAGSVAILTEGERPVIAALSAETAVGEWARVHPEQKLGSTSGFGVLNAKKPGESKMERALELIEHTVTVKVQGRIVRTVVEEEFQNSTADSLEGIYTFPLPGDARIAGLDLVVDGAWREGTMVEREKAGKIWKGMLQHAAPGRASLPKEEYMWVAGPWRDPAILNWKQGSSFELKIFPIPPNGSRRVRITYTQLLKPVPGGYRYTLPMGAHPDGKARTERFRFNATLFGVKREEGLRVSPYAMEVAPKGDTMRISYDVASFKPKGDLTIDIPDNAALKEVFAYAYKPSGKNDEMPYALLALRPAIPFSGARTPLHLIFAVDTSYSTQSLRLKRAAAVIAMVTRDLGPSSTVTLLRCAAKCAVVGAPNQAATPAHAATLARSILAMKASGSTRLDAIFPSVRAQISASGVSPRDSRFIYVGDGIPSAGEFHPSRLGRLAREKLMGVRITTLSLGGHVDEVVMRGLASGTGGAFIKAEASDTLAGLAFSLIMKQWGEPLRGVSLVGPDALKEPSFTAIPELWPGEQRLFLFRMERDRVSGEVVLSGTLGGKPFRRTYRVNLTATSHKGNAFVPRVWAERRIETLQLMGGESLRNHIVAISKRHHVLSRYTSLLVLESAAMAKAFDISSTRPGTDWTGETPGQESEVFAPLPELKSSSRAPMRSARIMGGRSADSHGGRVGKRSRRVRRPPAPFTEMEPTIPTRLRRRVNTRVATIYGPTPISPEMARGIERAKRLHAQNPASRERTRDLVRACVLNGETERATELARRWQSKDRLDAGALLARSYLARLEGRLEESERHLASALDVDPTSVSGHTALYTIYRASGRFKMMCAHALSRALLAPKNVHYQVEAARCTLDKKRHFAKLTEQQRSAAERELLGSAAAFVRHDITIDMEWQGTASLDIVVISPRGRVISWHGGAKRLSSKGGASDAGESISFSAEELGDYTVLLVAPFQRGAITKAVPVRITMDAFGRTSTSTVAFKGKRMPVGLIRVAQRRSWELVAFAREPRKATGLCGVKWCTKSAVPKPPCCQELLPSVAACRKNTLDRLDPSHTDPPNAMTRSGVARCMRAARMKRALTVRTIIDCMGRVYHVTLLGRGHSRELRRCVARVMHSSAFPPTRTQTTTVQSTFPRPRLTRTRPVDPLDF